MSNPTARNHYLPQFYLRRFCDESKRVLRTFKAPDGRLHEGRFSPKATGNEEHLYSLFGAGLLLDEKRLDAIEREVMVPIDTAGAEALQRMLAAEQFDLSADEKRRWATFVNSLIERHPQRVRAGDAQAVAMAKERMALLRERFGSPQEGGFDVFAHIDTEQLARNMHRRHIAREILDPKRIEYLQGFDLVKVSVPLQSPFRFVTGDNPVLVNNGAPWPVTWFSLALEPRALLIAHSADEDPDRETLGRVAMLHNPQLFSQCEYIFSRDPLVDFRHLQQRSMAHQFLKQVPWRKD